MNPRVDNLGMTEQVEKRGVHRTIDVEQLTILNLESLTDERRLQGDPDISRYNEQLKHWLGFGGRHEVSASQFVFLFRSAEKFWVGKSLIGNLQCTSLFLRWHY